ncbi:PAS domain S-box protein [Thermostichus vulcanus]|uniref:histidine kinase n=1 Tax=Thermostichus vulcanus str. 'Rupite' TaxID=2813851 RepID=A0ABT0C9X6_THEVL|nr:PAS domain S-box protein [Thermostichus vulcanus]MCJ2542155.1 PAS domain S-box protein [Thermostichus vulcanus str. 'Rupite']
MSPPISRLPGSRVNGLVSQQTTPVEEWTADTSSEAESTSPLYPLLQLLGRLLKVPWVYLALDPLSCEPHSLSASEGILYRDPQLLPTWERLGSDPYPASEQWAFHQAFPLQDDQGSRLADLHLFDYRPRQLSPSEQEQVSLITLSLRGILIQIQEHRQIQAHLQTQVQDSQNSATRYRQIFENAIEGIFQTTPDGKHLVANPALAHLFGYDSPEDLMHNVSDIGSQIYADPDRREEFVQRMLTEGQVVDFEHQVCRKDGKLIWVSLNARTIYNEQGEPLYFEGFVTDITAAHQLKERQRQSEEALRESEFRFLQLAANTQQLFWITTVYSKELIYVSPACERIWGRSVEECYANPQAWIRQIHPDDRWLFPSILKAQSEGQQTDVTFRVIRTDGKIIWLRERSFPIRDKNGKVYRVAGIAEDITESKQLEAERHQIEQAWQQSAKHFRQIFQLAPNGIALVDLQGRFIQVNDAFAEIVGYNPEELKGRQQLDILYPEDVIQLLEANEALLTGKVTVSQRQIRCTHRSGQIIHLLFRVTLLTDEASNPTEFLVQVIDISARVEAERALKESEERFRQTFELAPIAKAMTNLKGEYLQINSAFTQTLGYTLADLQGKTILDITHPDDVAATVENVNRLLTGAAHQCEQEKRYFHKNGQVIHAILRITLVRTDQGDPSYFLSQILDITERKQAEAALRQSELSLRGIFEQSALGISIADQRGHYVKVNPALEEMLGYSAAELASMSFCDFTHPEDVSQNWQLFQEIWNGQRDHYRLEKRYIHRNGQIFWCRLAVSAVRDADGKNLFTIGISEDITEEKRAELQIQAALQEKEILLREIHHRVKNNLQIISSLLRLQADQIKSRKYARVFRDAGSRIQAMSLIHEGLYQSNNLAAVDLTQYLHNLISNLFHSYGVNPESIRASIRAEGIRLSIDEAVLCGLIINELVTNSLKYAFPKGRSGEIHVHFSQTRKFTQLRVSDDGIGLPPDFDFKETQSLGLQLVATLTEQLEGKIESKNKTGTTFIITFPRIES